MKKKIIQKSVMIIMLLLSMRAFAQNEYIKVESFLTDSVIDLAAHIEPRKDPNNKDYAIIKLETTLSLQDFTFEASDMAISIEPEQKNGKIWIYISPGARWITIHSTLGTISNFGFYGETLKESTVYIMKLKEFATLSVTANVPAEVSIGGKNYGKTSVTTPPLPIGSTTVSFSAKGYKPYVQTINLVIGANKIEGNLELATGTLKITANVPADVSIGGKNYGKTSLTTPPLPIGSTIISFSADGYKSYEQTVNLVEGVNEIKGNLKPTIGTLKIKANVPADVLIDGENYGKTPLTVKNLPLGSTTVSLSAKDYKPYKQTVNLVAGVNKIKGKLEPTTGTLKITLMSQLTGKIMAKHH